MPSAIDGLDEDNHKEIYDNTFDLSSVFSVKSSDELKTMLDEHYYVKDASTTTTTTIMFDKEENNTPVQTAVSEPVVEEKKDDNEDEVLKELLEGLDV
jgi:hypothetical protein